MKIYKYLNLQRGADFLNFPLLRISKNDSLNDPFEFLLTEKSITEIETLFKKKYDNHVKEYISKFWTHGIISLTTTNDNLLMWSHYSDEYKGMVIGFEIDENNPSSFFLSKDTYKFEKVQYKYIRDFENTINENNLDEAQFHYMLTKSIVWSYENEYRYIIDYRQSDLIFLDTTNELFDNTIKNLNINPEKNHKIGQYLVIALKECVLTEDELLKIWILSSHIGAMFFKLIDYSSIKEIFVGSRVDCMSLNKLFTEEISNDILKNRFCDINNNIKNVYKCKLNDDAFKIDFLECTASFLDYIS